MSIPKSVIQINSNLDTFESTVKSFGNTLFSNKNKFSL